MIMSFPAASVMFSSFFIFHVHSLYDFLLFASPSISRSPLPANVCFPPSWFYTPPYCVKPLSNCPHYPCVFSLCASCSLCQFIFVPTVKHTSIIPIDFDLLSFFGSYACSDCLPVYWALKDILIFIAWSWVLLPSPPSCVSHLVIYNKLFISHIHSVT